jgi:hypothetical protein
MTKRLRRTTLGVRTFSGLGKGTIRLCWDNRRAPNKEEDLLYFYTAAVRSQNSHVARFTYGANFGESPFHALR